MVRSVCLSSFKVTTLVGMLSFMPLAKAQVPSAASIDCDLSEPSPPDAPAALHFELEKSVATPSVRLRTFTLSDGVEGEVETVISCERLDPAAQGHVTLYGVARCNSKSGVRVTLSYGGWLNAFSASYAYTPRHGARAVSSISAFEESKTQPSEDAFFFCRAALAAGLR